MPRKPKSSTSEAPLAHVPSEILDQLVGPGPLSPEELAAAVRRFKKALIERALGGELTHPVGYPSGGTKLEAATNHRHGTSGKTGLTDDRLLAIDVPRDRDGTCEPRCIARNSLDFVNWKERQPVAAARRPIYTAASADAARTALDAFESGPWGIRFPTVVAAWRRAWTQVIPFFAFPPDVRRVIYTTHALERVHARRRKIINTRGHVPSDDAATKLIWLARRNITAAWARAAPTWTTAMNQFAILYGDRFTAPNG